MKAFVLSIAMILGGIMADESLYIANSTTTFEPAQKLIIHGGVDNGPLLEIDLKTGTVTAHDSLSATEAGRVFVDYVRRMLEPCGSVKVE
jgi:hypothetical protein